MPRAHRQKSRRPPFGAREHGGGLDRSADRQRTQAHDRPRRTPTTSCRRTSVVSVAAAVPSAQGGDHRVEGERAWSCGGLSGRPSDGLLRAGLDTASLNRHGPGLGSYWQPRGDLRVRSTAASAGQAVTAAVWREARIHRHARRRGDVVRRDSGSQMQPRRCSLRGPSRRRPPGGRRDDGAITAVDKSTADQCMLDDRSGHADVYPNSSPR